jgi:hypothetical protein
MSARADLARRVGNAVIPAVLLVAAVAPTRTVASVENRTGRDLWLRPEQSIEPVALPPTRRSGPVDALADPVAHPGMIYRACDYCSIVVEEEGRVKALCSGLASCACQILRGGWKDHAWLHRQQTAYYDDDWDPLFERADAVTSLRAR